MAEKLLTIFTAPKPFQDKHICAIQRNALRSWQALGAQVEIILMGADAGIAENAEALGIRHYGDVKVNPKGTPLISSMLAVARELSDSPFFGIVNTDIILFGDLLDAISQICRKFERFLIIGQRWDMDIRDEISVDAADLHALRQRVPREAVLHPPMGSDYFVFPRSCYQQIPDFAIGRAGWDNWFIYKSRLERWKIVDATADVRIIHQNHDYRHLPDGQPHYRLPETKENVERAGGEHTIFALFDAQYELRGGSIFRKKLTLRKIMREIEIFPITVLHADLLGKFCFYAFRPQKAYALIRRKMKGQG